MGLGPTQRRGWADIGLQASQTLAGTLGGGGVNDLLHTALQVRSAAPRPGVDGANLPLLTDYSEPGVGSYADGALTEALPSGLWLIGGHVTLGWPEGETGSAIASITTIDNNPIAPEQTGPSGETSTVVFPTYTYVSGGNASVDIIRMLTGVAAATVPTSADILLTALLVAHTNT